MRTSFLVCAERGQGRSTIHPPISDLSRVVSYPGVGLEEDDTSRENDANRNSRTCIAACSARRDDCRCDILAGTHDQWATVTARISRPDRNRGMTPSCSSGVFSGTTFAHRQRRARVGADARRGDAADGDRYRGVPCRGRARPPPVLAGGRKNGRSNAAATARGRLFSKTPG
jgi:hypothetical protein